jgi:hypothetical protein
MDVAESMASRGYGRPGRTFGHRDRRRRSIDLLTGQLALLAAGALVGGLVAGVFRYRYYPLLDDPWPGLLDPVWLVTLACFVVPVVWLTLPSTWDRRTFAEARRAASPLHLPRREPSLRDVSLTRQPWSSCCSADRGNQVDPVARLPVSCHLHGGTPPAASSSPARPRPRARLANDVGLVFQDPESQAV